MTALERAEKLTELGSIKEKQISRAGALARLSELLGDDDVEVRAEAAGAVWSYPEEAELVAAVLELANSDGATQVRQQALTSLGRVIQEGVLAGAEEEGYAPDLALGEPTAATFKEVKELLMTVLLLGEADPAEKRIALESLAYLSDSDEVVQAIEAQLAEGDPASRVCAIRCMGRSRSSRWSESIRGALEADEAEVVRQAIQAAGEAEVVAAVPFLSRILKGSRQPQTQRIKAAQALACLGGENTAAALLEVAEGDSDDDVREAAQQALGDLTLLGKEPA